MPTGKDWHGLIGGDPVVEGALEQLHLAIEAGRRSGVLWPPGAEDTWDAKALAHTILYDAHEAHDLARLAVKLATRVEALQLR